MATDEIKVGITTTWPWVANLIEADLLVLLTDTDGLFTADPGLDPAAEIIERVERIDQVSTTWPAAASLA